MINLDGEDIMSAKDASQKWGKSDDYVRQMYRKYPDKFPAGSIRKFGKQLVVTRQGMETVTGIKKSDL
ncbi:helix-turn-helix domain-containing protein [Weissella viridescens]|uniref:helix-turn-helix domain-containing protein n=1 Tax=Weissella viridescens TaxID=1629 RepID=UPI003AF2DC02